MSTTTPPALLPTKTRRRGRIVRWTALVLVAGVFAASLVCNYFLYRFSDETYRELAEARLDPLGLKRPGFADAPPSTAPWALPVAVFFGDSRARDWTSPNVPGYQFIHRGIGGQTSEQVRGRIAQHLLPLNAKVVIVQVGINDLKTLPLLPANRRAQITKDCHDNIAEIVKQATAANAIVILTTIFPTGDVPVQRRMVWSTDIDAAVEEVNADLRQMASSKVIILDAWKLLQQNGKFRPDVAADTLHLNSHGYELLNEKLADVMKSLPAR